MREVSHHTDITDRKDVDAAVAVLGSARAFPAGGFDSPAHAPAFLSELWASQLPHRHEVSHLVVLSGGRPPTWTARAHYTRWLLDPSPVLHTLGEYPIVVTEPDWAVVELTVTRTRTTV